MTTTVSHSSIASKSTPKPFPEIDLSDMNLWQRISGVRSQIERIEYDRTIGEGDNAYQVASHEAIRSVLRPLMAHFGLVDWVDLLAMELWDTGVERGKYAKRKVFQHRGTHIYHIKSTDRTVKDLQAEGSAIILAASNFIYEEHSFKVIGYGDDAGDKGPGKAATYALKTAQKIMFLISTGDDDEEGRPSEAGEHDAPAGAATLTPEQLDQLIFQCDEYYGDDSAKRLKDMCENIFHVEAVKKIPRENFQQALNILKNQAIRDGKIESEREPGEDDDKV